MAAEFASSSSSGQARPTHSSTARSETLGTAQTPKSEDTGDDLTDEPKAPPAKQEPDAEMKQEAVNLPTDDTKTAPPSVPKPTAAPLAPPTEQEQPYDSTGVPPPPPVRPPSMRDQCSDQGFQDWVKTVGEVQAITAPQVMGLLSAGEWSKVWQRRLDILREPPLMLQCIHDVQTATGLRWQVLMTAKATIGASGDITISTYRDEHWVDLDSPTKWIGGLSALIKAAVQTRFQVRTAQDAEEFMLFAATFSTIYDLAAKQVNSTSKISYMIKPGPTPEAHFRIQHHEWCVTRPQHQVQTRGVRRSREDTEEEGWGHRDKRSGWSWSWYDQR